MAVATQGTASNYLQRAPSPSGLADVVDLILDKGLVIDAYIRIAVIGIELITIDARIVIASVDTYLRFAEAVNRLDLQAVDNSKGLPDLLGDAEHASLTLTDEYPTALLAFGGDLGHADHDPPAVAVAPWLRRLEARVGADTAAAIMTSQTRSLLL